jgi:hypothetical protein
MSNPMFQPPLNTNKLNSSDVKDMPLWMTPVLDFVNKIAEAVYYAQEFDFNSAVENLIPDVVVPIGAVESVNGETGVVVLDTDNIPEGAVNKYFGSLADGSAASPSLPFTNSPTTGVFRPAANQIGFATGGAERFRIDSTGQLMNVYESTVGTDYSTTLHNIYGARAWVNFNGTGTVAIRASGNVSSITDNGTGDYTVNFTTAMPDADYSVVLGQQRLSASRSAGGQGGYLSTVNSTRVSTYDSAFSSADFEVVSIGVFR